MKKTKYLQLFDYIGPKQSLYVNQNSIHKSSLGGILTILIFVLSALSFIGFGYDIFEKRKPEIFSSKQLNYTNSIKINNTLFAFSPQLYGGLKIPDLERRLIPNMEYVLTKSNHTTIFDVPLVKCKETESFKRNLYDLKSNILGNLDDYYCISENFTKPIIGKIGNREFGAIKFNLL
jgi:hypothetical protein